MAIISNAVTIADAGAFSVGLGSMVLIKTITVSSDTGIGYDGNRDLAQATGFQELISGIGNDTDGNGNGELFLFNPSSTTFVTHFMATTVTSYADEAARRMHVAGYINTTAAIDEIQFKMSSGNIDAGDICLYSIA